MKKSLSLLVLSGLLCAPAVMQAKVCRLEPETEETRTAEKGMAYQFGSMKKAGESDRDAFNRLIKENALVIFKFSASWCGPCRSIAPLFHELAEKYTSILFVDIDVDRYSEITSGVSSIPTFKIYKNHALSLTWTGGDKAKLRKNVAALVS